MASRKKNPVIESLIEKLSSEKAPVWKAVAKGLNRPRRIRYEVSLSDLEKNSDPKLATVVPGIVLGNGDLKKKLTVAALKFTRSSKEKIEKAGGKCLSITELVEKHKDGKGVKILG